MSVRESIEACWRSGQWRVDQVERLLFWLSQEDPVQLEMDFAR